MRGQAPSIGRTNSWFTPAEQEYIASYEAGGSSSHGEFYSPLNPSIGLCIDMINALSEEDRKKLYELLNLAPRGATSAMADVPSGYTRDPSSGRVYKMLPKKEHTSERSSLESAVSTAANALKVHSDSKGITVVTESDQKRVNYPSACSQADKDENLRLKAALDAAKLALANYKTQHMAEFKPPPRGRGRGRGSRGRAPARG